MRIILFSILITLSNFSFAQLQEGFDESEAADMIGLCNSYTFLHLFDSDKKVVPKSYEKLYTSKVIGMDNKFQVYRKGNLGVINFRGSTDNTISWVENMYSAMIPANGVIKIQGEPYPYSFAKDPTAGVHAGYALAFLFLSEDLLQQINALNNNGIFDIIITGHSQGGALSTLTRAFLENLSEGVISSKNNFKTYAFGNPMCGNKTFATEYNQRFSDNNTSFSIINPNDPIPYMPGNFEEEKLISADKILGWVSGEQEFSPRVLGQKILMKTFEGKLGSYVKGSNKLINRLISLKFGKVEMPEYLSEINYFPTGKREDLSGFDYPQIKIDHRKITEENKKDFILEKDGHYYKKEPNFFQHNPYNYYTGVLKKYDAKRYNKLKLKYLKENL